MSYMEQMVLVVSFVCVELSKLLLRVVFVVFVLAKEEHAVFVITMNQTNVMMHYVLMNLILFLLVLVIIFPCTTLLLLILVLIEILAPILFHFLHVHFWCFELEIVFNIKTITKIVNLFNFNFFVFLRVFIRLKCFLLFNKTLATFFLLSFILLIFFM